MKMNPNKSYLAGGIILVIIGLLWLVRSIGFVLPEFVISPQTVVILIGLITLIQYKFQSEAGWVIFLFGNVWMLHRVNPGHNILSIGTASIILGLGIYFLAKYFYQSSKLQQ
jgi:hypothetical protein